MRETIDSSPTGAEESNNEGVPILKELRIKAEEEKRMEEEIENLSKEEREALGFGLNRIGFSVEQKKNEFFAGVLKKLVRTEGTKRNKVVFNFCIKLADSFERDAQRAHERAKEAKEGKGRGVSNTLSLVGNVARYGRIITDLSARSLASPLRYVIMASMAFTRGAEAAKETRLSGEESMKKTRITDAERACKEAWEIHERAKSKKKDEGGVSAEELNEAYLMELPKNLLKSLQDPSTANGFLQRIIRRDIQGGIKSLTKKIERINSDKKLSEREKERKTEQLTKRYEARLRDYDRMLTEYGTVDQLALAGHYAQFAGKTVTRIVTAETIALSAEKLIEGLSHVLIPEALAAQEVPHTGTIPVAEGEVPPATEEGEQEAPARTPGAGFAPAEGDTIVATQVAPKDTITAGDTITADTTRTPGAGFVPAEGEVPPATEEGEQEAPARTPGAGFAPAEGEVDVEAGEVEQVPPATEEGEQEAPAGRTPGSGFVPLEGEADVAELGGETEGGSGADQERRPGDSENSEALNRYLQEHPDDLHEVRSRSHFSNNTEVSDKNELRTLWGGENGTGINTEGNAELNVSSMTAEGSSRGDLSVNTKELIEQGKAVFLLSSPETSGQVIEVPINEDGKIIFDSELTKMFFREVDGRAQFTGSYGEVAEKLDDEGNYRIFSTIVGSQEEVTEVPQKPSTETRTAGDETWAEKERREYYERIGKPELNPDTQPPTTSEPGTTEEPSIRKRVHPRSIPSGSEPTETPATPEEPMGPRNYVYNTGADIEKDIPTQEGGGQEPKEVAGGRNVFIDHSVDTKETPTGNRTGYNTTMGGGRGGYYEGGLQGSLQSAHIDAVYDYLDTINVHMPEVFNETDIFKLPMNEIEETVRLYNDNIEQLIPQSMLDDGWKVDDWWGEINNVSARELLREGSNYDTEEYQGVRDYFNFLIEGTGEKPKGGGLFGNEESAEKFAARALYEAQKNPRIGLRFLKFKR